VAVFPEVVFVVLVLLEVVLEAVVLDKVTELESVLVAVVLDKVVVLETVLEAVVLDEVTVLESVLEAVVLDEVTVLEAVVLDRAVVLLFVTDAVFDVNDSLVVVPVVAVLLTVLKGSIVLVLFTVLGVLVATTANNAKKTQQCTPKPERIQFATCVYRSTDRL